MRDGEERVDRSKHIAELGSCVGQTEPERQTGTRKYAELLLLRVPL